jgi:hypothetical protein
MTKVPVADQIGEIEKILGDFARLLESWKKLAAEAEKAGVPAELNRLKTAVWNLRNTYEMFEKADDDTGTIVSKIECSATERVELAAIVGAILLPEMKGKSLDLMAFRLGKNGEPLSLDGYAGTPLILPKNTGPVVLPYEIKIPIRESGIYGFYLFDRDGVFAPKTDLLATYMYSAVVTH